ncbi:12548_t:CDS:2, partial [Acaulospora morrowiae]
MEIFRAHSVILRARSLHFRTLLSDNLVKREQDECYTFVKPHISPNVFKHILKYIYTGMCDLENCDFLIELLVAADELILDGFVKHIQNYIILNKTFWLRENLVRLFQISSKHESFSELRETCGQQISRSPDLILRSTDIVYLEKRTLLTFIKRDDIATDEINIWNAVIKWGMGQDFKLDDNIESWTKGDFEELKIRVQDFFPYIRFFTIP